MRLICPNCSAEYEVAEDAIPPVGRDVQCSNCGITWFQPGSGAAPADMVETVSQTSEASASVEQATPQPLDPAVAAILRQEREFESKAREADALESQQEMDLSADASKSRIRRSIERAEAAVTASAVTANETGRRKSLPDIDEINSTLGAGDEVDVTMPPPPNELPKSSGFWLGFGIAVILVGLLAAIYLYDDEVIEMMPSVAGLVADYVDTVDAGLRWIGSQMQSFVAEADEPVTGQ